MTPKTTMDLKDIESLAKNVGLVLEKITNKPLDLSNLELSLDDGNILNDEDVMKIINMGNRLKTKYKLADWIQEYQPFSLAKNILGKVGARFMGTFILMKYNQNGKIAVNPRLLTSKSKLISCYLSHELTHVQDWNLYQDQRFPLLEKRADLEEKLLDKRHELGLFKGYLRPAQEVRLIEEQIKEQKDILTSYMTVIESHAEYVKSRFYERENLKPNDIINLQLIGIALLSLPFLLLPGQRQKIKQYHLGKDFIEMVYAIGVDMSVVYGNLPTTNELGNPQSYFERMSIRNQK